jgi:hypothetical protein
VCLDVSHCRTNGGGTLLGSKQGPLGGERKVIDGIFRSLGHMRMISPIDHNDRVVPCQRTRSLIPKLRRRITACIVEKIM